MEIKRIIAEIKSQKCWRKCSGTFQKEEQKYKGIEDRRNVKKLEDWSKRSNIEINRVPGKWEQSTYGEEIISKIIQEQGISQHVERTQWVPSTMDEMESHLGIHETSDYWEQRRP